MSTQLFECCFLLPPSAGVVHGDLKAANVLLTRGGEDVGGLWGHTLGYRVTAKVADFGLALSLDPKDTHATMAARVRAPCTQFGCFAALAWTASEEGIWQACVLCCVA
jgi:serine/threonine protein kinase